jgi:hypothetical protein
LKRGNLREPIPPGGVLVARPDKWGNPFVVGRDGTRAEVVKRPIPVGPTDVRVVVRPRWHKDGESGTIGRDRFLQPRRPALPFA